MFMWSTVAPDLIYSLEHDIERENRNSVSRNVIIYYEGYRVDETLCNNIHCSLNSAITLLAFI